MKKKEIGIALLAVSAVAGAFIALKKRKDHREGDKKQTISKSDYSSKEEDDDEDREAFYELLRMLESPKDLSNYMEKAAAKVILKQTKLAVFNDHLKEAAVGTSELIQNMNYGDELLMEYCGEHLKENGSFDTSLFETFVEFKKALLALLYRVETTVKQRIKWQTVVEHMRKCVAVGRLTWL